MAGSQNTQTGIPEAHREIFNAIRQQVAELHFVWQIFRQLYAKDDFTLRLLNDVAPAFFKTVEDALLDSVVLGLTRLLDPKRTKGGIPHLVIELLRDIPQADPAIKSKLKAAIRKMRHACESLEMHRNARLAHSDLPVVLGQEPLPGFSRKTVEDALRALREAMQCVHQLENKQVAYDHLHWAGDGDSLVSYLRSGMKLERIRRIHDGLSERKLRRWIDKE